MNFVYLFEINDLLAAHSLYICVTTYITIIACIFIDTTSNIWTSLLQHQTIVAFVNEFFMLY